MHADLIAGDFTSCGINFGEIIWSFSLKVQFLVQDGGWQIKFRYFLDLKITQLCMISWHATSCAC